MKRILVWSAVMFAWAILERLVIGPEAFAQSAKPSVSGFFSYSAGAITATFVLTSRWYRS